MMNPQRWTAFLAVAVALLATTCLAVAEDDAAVDVRVGRITLHVPKTWKREEAKSSLRLAQFGIPAAEGDKEDAELAIFSFGGGDDAETYIKRWVALFSAEGRKVKIVTGKAELGQYVLVDISGTYKKPVIPIFAGKTEDVPGSRVLWVILAVPEKGTFFLNIQGLDKTVAAQSLALRKSFGADPKGERELKLEE